MKNLIITLAAMFMFSCANHVPIPVEPAPISEIDQAINDIEAMKDQWGLFEHGENAFYQQGYYIYAMHKHGKLTEQLVKRYCDALDDSIVADGYNRRPDLDYHMSRDDYILTAVGLYFGKGYNDCCEAHLSFIQDHRKLDGGLWSPHHSNIFKRANESYNPWLFSDVTLLVSAYSVCDTPPDNTSDKLLMAAMFIMASEVTPTSSSNEASEYCHSKVDYDAALDVYYSQGQPIGILLKGLL